MQRCSVDAALQVEIQSEEARWREVLIRLLNCIKYLVTQNLAFCGYIDNLDTAACTNVGNFLSLLNLLAQYDPLLKSHLEHVRQNPGSVSYLSPEFQNEFVRILASTVRNHLLSDIKRINTSG